MTVSRETSQQARQARRERIAAGKAEPEDYISDTEVICPYCGDSRLGRSAHADTDKELIPYGLTVADINKELIPHGLVVAEKTQLCPNCGGMFILRVEHRRTYSTRIDRMEPS